MTEPDDADHELPDVGTVNDEDPAELEELPDVGTVDDEDPLELDEEDLDDDDDYFVRAANRISEDHPDVDDDDEIEIIYEEGAS